MNILKKINELNNENTILIVADNIKQKLIKLKTKEEIKQAIFYKFKIMSISEFITMATFDVDSNIYLLDEPISLIKEKVKFAKYNLNNINEYLNEFKRDNKKFINENKPFITNMHKYSFFVIGCDIYLKPIFDHYDLSYQVLKIEESSKHIKVKKFLNKTEEVFYLFEDISKRLANRTSIDKIYVANLDTSYYGELIKHSTFYNIPIDFNLPVYLYDISFIKSLLSMDYDSLIKLIKDPNKLNEEFLKIKDIDALYFDNMINELITIINKYSNKYDKYKLMEVIKDDAKNKRIKETYFEAVKFIDVDEILTLKEDEVAYILNARYEAFPNIVKNNDLLTDNDKDMIGYPNSSKVNEAFNKYYENIIKSKNVVYLSFPLKDKYTEFEPSDIISNLLTNGDDFKEIKETDLGRGYAREYYKQRYSKNEGKHLLTHFTGGFNLNKDERDYLINYLNKLNIKLSPTLVTRYLRVPFIYYVESILRISTFQENISVYLGNFFHSLSEVLLTIKFKDVILVKETYHYNEQLNELIIQYINSFNKDEDINYYVYFDEFYKLYFNNVFKKKSDLQIKTLFFVKKNKELFIEALELIINRYLDEDVKEVYIEKEIVVDNVNSKADLIQIYRDNSYSIIDYKSGGRTPYSTIKVVALIDDLLNKQDIELAHLDLIQPLFYSLYLNKLNEKYTFRDVGFYSFFNEKPKINALMTESLNGQFYTLKNERLISYEELDVIYEDLEVLFNRIMKDILNARFEIEVIKDKDNKQNLEKEWYGVYEAVAFFNKNDFLEDEDEE